MCRSLVAVAIAVDGGLVVGVEKVRPACGVAAFVARVEGIWCHRTCRI
jgi:hypothetical protein